LSIAAETLPLKNEREVNIKRILSIDVFEPL